ncbi:putative RNA-directed DNA polymerase [Helianthus annuus]|nr:putative RNA-directed DNA polymerase [Helianthus annuus]
MDFETKEVFFSRDVKFYETVFPLKTKTLGTTVDQNIGELNTKNFFDFCFDVQNETFEHQPPDDEERTVEGEGSGCQPSGNIDSAARMDGCPATSDETRSEKTGTSPEGDMNSTSEFTNVRKSGRTVNVPSKFNDFVIEGKVKYGLEKTVSYSKLSAENKCFVSELNKMCEPTSYEEACLDPNWVRAMNEEMEALNRNNTWIITDLPENRKPIGCKWIYKIKYRSNGEIERYKARLVAKGFNQREGLDFDETFSPVVKMVTVRCLISLAVQNSWPLYQLDVNNAFLYGEMSEDVYMDIPEGYVEIGSNKVCKLVKSLYGLKQAPRKWNEKLTSTLIEMGFEQSKNDYSLFIKSKNNVFVSLLVYVDDIVVTGNDENEINLVKTELSQKFMIKDLGKLKYFLGIEVIESELGICLSQRKYCIDLIDEFGMLGSKPVFNPIEQNVVVTDLVNSKSSDFELTNITNYQKLIGKLIYLTLTRPDISYAVHCLSQFMHKPLNSHFKIALRLLRYLKSSPGKGILFSKSDSFELKGYVDSDWGKCLSTRRSVTGYYVYLGNCLVSWKSKKQNTVSRSSAEAEFRAMNVAGCEIIYILKILEDLKLKPSLPVKMFSDNSAAIQIAANPVFHDRTKHFEIDLYFLREKVAAGVFKIIKIGTEHQPADLFTKGLNITQHNYLCKKLQLLDLFGN